MKNKLNDLHLFLISKSLSKQAFSLQKLKEEVSDFSEEYIDPYLDDAKEYADPYLNKAKEYIDPYLDDAKEYAEPYLDKAKDYIKDVVKEDKKSQALPVKSEHYDPKDHKDDSKYKSWSSADNIEYKYKSNFAKVHGNNNYRSAKPIAEREFFEYLKDKYNIDTIINLIGGFAINIKEKKAVTDAGLEYIPIPMFNKPPSESDWSIFNSAMRSGNALVHCHHGADRTGAMIARWEIENGEKSTDEAYASALRYGFKPKDFKYKGGKIDPNRHLREYIFDSKQKSTFKENDLEQTSFFDDALSYGKEKIRDYINEDTENLFENQGDYTDKTGLTPLNPRIIYNYLRNNIGMKENQALGITSNIYRESGYMPGAKGDGGDSWGLFQMNGSRRKNMVKDVPDWKTNWRGQINHAVYTDPSSDLNVMRRYMEKDFESPGHAGYWFAVQYERPAAENRKNPNWYNKKIKSEGLIS